MTEREIIDHINMQDCHDQQIQVFDLLPDSPTELMIRGKRHDPRNPLYIKLINPKGEIVISGCGEDH